MARHAPRRDIQREPRTIAGGRTRSEAVRQVPDLCNCEFRIRRDGGASATLAPPRDGVRRIVRKSSWSVRHRSRCNARQAESLA